MKMKQLTMLVVAALMVSQAAMAQISVGAKGGLNVSNLNGLNEANFDTKALVGFHAGGYVTFNLGRNFALQPELVYSTQGAQLENATEDLKLNYFNVPVVVKFLTNNGFYIEAGPQLGFQVGSVDNEDFEEDVKNSDFSIVGGVGFQPTKSAFGIGARYNLGLGKAGEINPGFFGNADYRNGVFQLSLYWRLLGGGKLKR